MNNKCSICNEKSVEKYVVLKPNSKITDKDAIIREEYFCAKHWVEKEGKFHLDMDLKLARENLKQNPINTEVVKEIWNQFPSLAKKYASTIRKIVKSNLK